MNIAVLSGKGGTGKTFISVNLAGVINNSTYLDCDVEEPDGHLFFDVKNPHKEDVVVKIPEIEYDKCNGCRKCVDFCKFNALAYIGNKPLKFTEICHSCGGCKIVCPQNAISEADHKIGEITAFKGKNINIISGAMNIGEESGVGIIRSVMERLGNGVNIIDCPPGCSCLVSESVKKADYCIIAAEPTIFGLDNFKMAEELLNLLNKPFGVVINKDNGEENPITDHCKKHNIPILLRIGYSKAIGELNASGKIAVKSLPELNELFTALYERLCKEVSL